MITSHGRLRHICFGIIIVGFGTGLYAFVNFDTLWIQISIHAELSVRNALLAFLFLINEVTMDVVWLSSVLLSRLEWSPCASCTQDEATQVGVLVFLHHIACAFISYLTIWSCVHMFLNLIADGFKDKSKRFVKHVMKAELVQRAGMP